MKTAPRKVTSIAMLEKAFDEHDQHDLAVALNHGAFSRKEVIRFTDGTLMIFHSIDGTTQNFDSFADLFANTILGDAFDQGALYIID